MKKQIPVYCTEHGTKLLVDKSQFFYDKQTGKKKYTTLYCPHIEGRFLGGQICGNKWTAYSFDKKTINQLNKKSYLKDIL